MSTAIIDDQETVDIVIGALQGCSTRLRVNEVFQKFAIGGTEQKIRLLRKAMGDPVTFYSDDIAEENKLQREISMLISKAWEMNKLYDRAGL